jgi:hypothetical protein
MLNHAMHFIRIQYSSISCNGFKYFAMNSNKMQWIPMSYNGFLIIVQWIPVKCSGFLYHKMDSYIIHWIPLSFIGFEFLAVDSNYVYDYDAYNHGKKTIKNVILQCIVHIT